MFSSLPKLFSRVSQHTCVEDRPNAVKQLLGARAEVNMANSKGQTALLMACQHDLRLVAKALIVGKADVNQANQKGKSPFSVCEELGFKDLARS